MRQAVVVNDVLLSKKQELFIRYHPISVLNTSNLKYQSFDIHDLTRNKIEKILDENAEQELSKIDKELIEKLLGKPNHENRSE